jgi:hypothetical protein
MDIYLLFLSPSPLLLAVCPHPLAMHTPFWRPLTWVITLSPPELAAKPGSYLTAATQAGLAEQVLAAANT